jgi:hypothetical protein
MDDGVDVVLLEYFEETRDIEQFALDGNDVGAWSLDEVPVVADRLMAGVGEFVDDVASGESGTTCDQNRAHVMLPF